MKIYIKVIKKIRHSVNAPRNVKFYEMRFEFLNA